MASTSQIAEIEVNSFIRGYHVYKDMWTPFIREELILRREPDDVKDRSAVVVVKDGQIVGHIPLNISAVVSCFLQRLNKGFAIVTGDRVNRGAGYGLEVPCTYKFYGQNYIFISSTDRCYYVGMKVKKYGRPYFDKV